jgi:hypothetical protein
VAHRDPVVHRDRVELAPAAPRLGDRTADHLAEILEVHVSGHELRERVRHRDDRLAKVPLLIPVARHSARAPAMFRP